MSFASFCFKPEIVAGIEACGYLAPTPIQEQALPPLLAGRDILGLAQTGTGKTAAFLLPILQRLQDGPRGRVRALIVAPTRELAEQIGDSARELGRKTRLRSVTIYGGVSKHGQLQKLKEGVEIVIACPGRLLDHLDAKAMSLAGVEMLVLDEADQMFDMGFLPAIRRILKYLPGKRQTMLFSATMPDDVRHLAHAILTDPVTVQIAHQKPAETVSQTLFPVATHLKSSLLLELLQKKEVGRTLIFTRTKHGAKGLAEKLEKAGHRAAALQGNLSQNRRREVLDGFKTGTVQVLVATDIAARGIDVAEISHVINYDMPETAEAYVHRIGRTGRATRSGEAFSLASRDESAKVRAIETLLGKRLEQQQLEGFDYTVPPRNTAPEARRPSRPSSQGKPRSAGRPASGGGNRAPSRPGQGPAAARSGSPRRQIFSKS
ncbi:MAG: DEAD/DEAH box helicase [Desulfobulbaceae bacterium]|nr:DEAD/DEAH box helicase [Desulfobulbaceae bacterium]